MKLENQVCLLDLAKKLKELGVKQESLFWWQGYLHSMNRVELVNTENLDTGYDHYSAFTVAELGEMLPIGVSSRKSYTGGDFMVKYKTVYKRADTEVNARAKILIYLLENKLIKL